MRDAASDRIAHASFDSYLHRHRTIYASVNFSIQLITQRYIWSGTNIRRTLATRSRLQQYPILAPREKRLKVRLQRQDIGCPILSDNRKHTTKIQLHIQNPTRDSFHLKSQPLPWPAYAP